jgi:hypothetical protein
LSNPFDIPPVEEEKDMLPTDPDHPNQTGIGEQTFGEATPRHIAPASEHTNIVADTIDSTNVPPQQTLTQPVVPFTQPKPEKKHHNIVDMYWFISGKLFEQKPLGEFEAGFLAIGYNADFSNLRIGFYLPNKESFTQSSMIKSKMEFMTSINLFSETCYNIRDCLRTGQPINVSNFERIIGNNGNTWTPNQTTISGTAEQIIIKTITPEGKKFYYTLSGWQIAAFASALKFMTEGDSWNKSLDVRMKQYKG